MFPISFMNHRARRPVVLGALCVAFGCGGATSGPAAGGAPTDSSTPEATVDTSVADAGDANAADASCPSIVATSYDQTCAADTDCVIVGTGNVCSEPCSFVCGIGDAIRVSDLPRYQADLAKTGFSSANIGCGCPVTLWPPHSPCCVAGKCQASCPNTATASPDASGDAGPYASLCPVPASDTQCPSAPDAGSCLGVCGLGALPSGLPCDGPTQCSLLIAPDSGCGRVDGYVCSCVGGRWSCSDCSLGATACPDDD